MKEEIKELEAIKKLLILLLIKLEVPADVVAKVLGIHPSRISQLIPVKKIKKQSK